MPAEIKDRAALIHELIERHSFSRKFSVDRFSCFAASRRARVALRSSLDTQTSRCCGRDFVQRVSRRQERIAFSFCATLSICQSIALQRKAPHAIATGLQGALRTIISNNNKVSRCRRSASERISAIPMLKLMWVTRTRSCEQSNSDVTIDSAANYRFQRSERSIGQALKSLSEQGFAREELVICTKGGYLPFDAPPRNAREYVDETFVKPGIACSMTSSAGSHCMTPSYLKPA